MCFGALFGISNNKKRKSSSSGERKRRERPPTETLRGDGVPVVAEVQEKRKSTERPRKKRTPETPRRAREEYRPRQQYQDVYRSRAQYKAPLHLEVPNMWYRSVDPESTNSSEEMLLNPRPHRSPHHRQRHPKHTSQTTLRGRGAPRKKSKKDIRPENTGWSFFAPTPPKTPKRRDHHGYQTLESSPRSHRSPRQHRSTQYAQETPESSRPQQRHHRSRQQQPSSRSTRHATPNTAVRRDPDRRFAVLAATNTALEELRREAFAQPSPPPRRERLRRYQGVTIPASSIPYSWDCVSSSQTSAGYGEPSTRQRRRR